MDRKKIIGSASDLDQIGDLQTGTPTKANGQTTLVYTTTYANVYSQKLAPMRTMGNESEQGNQTVYAENLSWKMRREDRTIIPKNMRYTVGGKYHYIKNVRDFKGSRDWIVIDTEYKDNQ